MASPIKKKKKDLNFYLFFCLFFEIEVFRNLMLFLSLHVIFKGSWLDLFGRSTLIIKTTSGTKVLENETLIRDQMGNNPKTKRAKI